MIIIIILPVLAVLFLIAISVVLTISLCLCINHCIRIHECTIEIKIKNDIASVIEALEVFKVTSIMMTSNL